MNCKCRSAVCGALTVWTGLLLAAPLAAQVQPKAKTPLPKAPAATKTLPKSGAAEKAAPEVKLNARQTAYLKNELLPAYQAGDPAALIRVIGEQIFRQSDQQTAALNQALAADKLPSLGRMLTDARMSLARLNAGSSAPAATMPEIVLMVVEIDRQVQEKVAAAKKLELFADPLPKPASLTEYRDHLWNAHVQNNELINAAFLATQGRALLQSPLIAKVKNPTPAQQAAFAIDFGKHHTEIVQLHRDLNERGVEFRIQRVEFALNVLEDARDIKQRMLAAYAAGVDGELLYQIVHNYRGQIGREKLRSPTLATELRGNVDHCKELAGDLIKKSELLYAGLHWWRRGRYGRGPEGNGLLKSEEALADPAAQIALFMPQVTPAPTDPAKGIPFSPDYDRRHHWTWAWQDRQFETVGSGGSSSSKTSLVNAQNKSLGHFDGHVEGRFY